MTDTASAPPLKPAPKEITGTFWEKLVDDLQRRPKYYVRHVLWITIPIVLVVLGFRVWSSVKESNASKIAIEWNAAVQPDVPLKQRAAGLEELGAKTAGSQWEQARLYQLAATYMDVADDAKTQEEKVAAYEKCLATLQKLEAQFPNSLWVKMPTRPAPAGSTAPVLTFAAQIKENAQKQIDWLKSHPYTGLVQPDKNLKATVELSNGKKFVIGKFYSRAMPYHVKNFLWLARDKKYFDNTAFAAFQKGIKKSDTALPGQQKATNIGINGGDPMTKVPGSENYRDDDGQQTDDIGYSVREETSPVPIGRGSVLSLMDYTTGGDSPSKFTIYSEEPTYAQGAVFAEVTEGLEVIDELCGQAEDEPRKDRPKELIRIKSITVEGDIENPPPTEFLPADITLPKSRAPESKPASDTTKTDTKPTEKK